MMGRDLQRGGDSILFRAVSREARIKNYKWGNELYYPVLVLIRTYRPGLEIRLGFSKCNIRSVF